MTGIFSLTISERQKVGKSKLNFRKMKYFYFIALFSTLLYGPSTTAQEIIDVDNSVKTELTHETISLPQAQELCRLVHESRIQTPHIYLWVQVKSNSKSTQQPEQQQEATLTPGCFNFKYVGCEGKPQYPISDSCGFFTAVPEKECSSTDGSGRSRRSTSSQQKITLSHGQAVQLCTSIQNLPEDTPFQVQYVPIKVSLDAQVTSEHLSDECVKWTNEPCAQENESGTKECKKWKLKIRSTPKCSHYTDFYKQFNSSQIARFPNPMEQKTDFIMSQELKQEDLAMGVNNFFSDSIECTRESLAVSCKIVKKGTGDRSKRAAGASTAQTPVSRVKRLCCGIGWCGACGKPRFFGSRQLCDCSNDTDDYCQNYGACDVHEYPSGCYGNCLY